MPSKSLSTDHLNRADPITLCCSVRMMSLNTSLIALQAAAMAQENMPGAQVPGTPEHPGSGLIQAARGQGVDAQVPPQHLHCTVITCCCILSLLLHSLALRPRPLHGCRLHRKASKHACAAICSHCASLLKASKLAACAEWPDMH